MQTTPHYGLTLFLTDYWFKSLFVVWLCVLAPLLVAGCKYSAYEFRLAVREGDTNIVEHIIKSFGDPNTLVPRGRFDKETLLHIAANEGSLTVSRMLLDYGADANATNSMGVTVLEHLIDTSSDVTHRGVFRLLLDRGAVPSGGALMRASAYGSTAYVEALLKAGADPNYRNDFLTTPLHEAGNGRIVNLLVEAGAEVNATNLNGMTPLDLAQTFSKIACPEILKHGGTNANPFSSYRESDKFKVRKEGGQTNTSNPSSTV
jgi:hypothetical protein